MIQGIDTLIRTRRRSVSIEISSEAKVIVRAPLSVPEDTINRFITSRRLWIIDKQHLVLSRRQKAQQFHWPQTLSEEAWRRHYYILSHRLLTQRCVNYAKHFGFTINRVKISLARTRWGACTGVNNILLNWRLIFTPLFVIDYLIIHELAHVAVKNHSAKFWRTVKDMCPDYLTAEKWLKENAYVLDI